MVEAVTLSPIRVAVGNNVTLEFRVNNSLPPVVLDNTNWRQVINGVEHTMGQSFEMARFTFSDDFMSVTIDPVDPADEAIYTLTVTNSAGLTGSDSIELDVERERGREGEQERESVRGRVLFC